MKSNIDVSQLNIPATPYDIRRDLFWFMQYCQDNEIKRTVYGNTLLKGVYKKLTKFIGHPELMEDYDKYTGIKWIDYLDNQALQLGWLSYDTTGEYRGYTSSEPAFDDNYIEVKQEKYGQFLKLSPLEQEKYLFRFLRDREHNELMGRSLYGRLDSFDRWGSGTGVLPTLDFPKSRKILLQALGKLEPATWYATADLIAYMKQHHPWFLIPKEVYLEESTGWRKPMKKVKYDRYYNFQEGNNRRRLNETHISDDDPLGFEKVEGRFIERFLEGFLLTLGYVEVAYRKEAYTGKSPSMGILSAFKLSPVFLNVLNNQPFKPKVSVQANFEIYVESPVYPMATLQALDPFADIIKEDRQSILKLKKQYVLHHLVNHPNFNIVAFLEGLSDTPLPQNVTMELKEWTERTDVFTLYEGYGLYEGLKKQAIADVHTEATISTKMRLVRQPEILYKKLSQQAAVPMHIIHTPEAFQVLPKAAKSVFPTAKVEKKTKAAKQKIVIKRQELLAYILPNQSFYEAFLLVVLKARLPVEANKIKKTLIFPKQEETAMKALLNDFKATYQIQIVK